jgi:ABC-2 type transport system ATP-binding protein
MHCHFYGVAPQAVAQRVDFVLDVVNLREWKRKFVSALSGGMKRRAEIARSILHLPKVLFLDEPTTGLDPQTRAHMWDYIVNLQREHGMTIFLTTHYMDEAEISRTVAIIDNGKIADIDTPYNLKQRYTRDMAYLSTSNGPELERLLAQHGLPYKTKATHYSVEATPLPALLETLAAHRPYITDMEIKKGTLNDVFLKITGKDIRL